MVKAVRNRGPGALRDEHCVQGGSMPAARRLARGLTALAGDGCRHLVSRHPAYAPVLRLCAVVWLAVLCVSTTRAATVPPEKRLIDLIWRSAKWDIAEQMDNGLSNQSAVVLYTVQIQTNMLLEHAAAWNEHGILDDLCKLLLIAYDHLELRETWRPAFHPHGPELPLNPPAKMWLEADGTLSRLHVSQFLYLVSRAVCVISDVKRDDRTEAMQRFLNCYVPVLVEHYIRWVCGEPGAFTNGFGGEKELMNHHEYLKRKYKRSFPGPKLSNAVVSWDVLIVGGVVELLAAHRREPDMVPISARNRSSLLKHVGLATALLRSRLTRTRLRDFEGRPAEGLHFDADRWDDWRDSAYAGYTGDAFPAERDKAKVENVGRDISHSRRLLLVFETLRRHRNVTRQSFPTRTVMRGLTNQLIYGTFNRDFLRPLFANYMSGANGWYRVGYGGNPRFGYGPHQLSRSVPTGGYLILEKYNPDVRRVRKALWTVIRGAMARVVLDASGNGYHAMCSGVAGTKRNGGDALQFLAGPGWIDGGIRPDLCRTVGTIEFWFRLNTPSTHQDIFYLYEKPYKDFLTVSRNKRNLIYLMIEDDDKQKLMVYREAPLSDTGWHHLAVIQDGSSARMVLDGVPCELKGANSGAWTKHLIRPRLWIGKAHLDATFDGCIDDLRIYDRALSDNEVAANFRSAATEENDDLVGSWNGRLWPANRAPDPELVAFLDKYYAGAGTVSHLREPFSIELLQFLASVSVARAQP